MEAEWMWKMKFPWLFFIWQTKLEYFIQQLSIQYPTMETEYSCRYVFFFTYKKGMWKFGIFSSGG